MTTHLRAYLFRHKVKRTLARDQVFDALQILGAPTIPQLVVSLAGKVGSATVYRTVELFLQLEIAEMIRHNHIELSYPFRYHHHHFVCQQCDVHVRFNDERMEQAIKRFSDLRLLDVTSHTIELRGICGKCSLKVAKTR